MGRGSVGVKDPPFHAVAFVLVGLFPAVVSAQASAARASVPASHAPRATLITAMKPGFETLPDGSTRLFVGLSGPAAYETRSVGGATAYVFKGAIVGRRNDCNPLVTQFFNTPVSEAKLVPHGHDLWFVVTLRANVTPVVTVESPSEGGARMSIQFPKGDYLPPEVAEAPAGDTESTAQGVGAPAAAPSTAPRPVPGSRAPGSGHTHRSRTRN